MKRILIACTAALALVCALVGGVTAVGASDSTSTVTGTFGNGHVVGYTTASETGDQITFTGSYSGLPKNSYSFTVLYAAPVCDPATAFPVPLPQADAAGNIPSFTLTVTDPLGGGLVAGTHSVSVREADTVKRHPDIDMDGKVGPTDVVAVPNSGTSAFPPSPHNYKIGLRQCASRVSATTS